MRAAWRHRSRPDARILRPPMTPGRKVPSYVCGRRMATPSPWTLLRMIRLDLHDRRARREEFRMRRKFRHTSVQRGLLSGVPRREHVQVRVGDRIVGSKHIGPERLTDDGKMAAEIFRALHPDRFGV